jgi:hypothetical protein
MTWASLHQLFDERARRVRRYPGIAMDQGTFVQHRLGSVKGWDIGALEESADGNFFAPELRFLHCGSPVSCVVSGVVLKFLHARAEPLVSIVVIICDAGAEDIEEREAFVHDALLDQFGEMLLLGAEAAGDKSAACS